MINNYVCMCVQCACVCSVCVCACVQCVCACVQVWVDVWSVQICHHHAITLHLTWHLLNVHKLYTDDFTQVCVW